MMYNIVTTVNQVRQRRPDEENLPATAQEAWDELTQIEKAMWLDWKNEKGQDLTDIEKDWLREYAN